MSGDLSPRIKCLILVAVVFATVSFHYGFIVKPTDDDVGLFHAVHGRLCYIPIILGAIWFGVRGGLGTAMFVILLTLPYGKYKHITDTSVLMNEYTEMVFYIAIGLTSGMLIELQRRERDKNEALAKELSRKEHLSSLGQMAAGLAHEIKNPLGSIKGSAEILSDDFPPESKKHELLEVLVKETSRLNRVVEDFLSFARPRPLSLSPTNINLLIRDVIAQLEIETKNRNITFMSKLDPSIAEIPLDREKIHQVLLNVGLNAVAALDREGLVTIRSQRKLEKGMDQVVVAITDDGEGISEENIEKIFNPFFTTKAKGTGLGLSISHMIIQNHGGRMEVASKKGEGTTFCIILPARRQ